MLDQAKKEAIIILAISVIVALSLLFCSFYFGSKLVSNINEEKTLKQEVETMRSSIEMNKIIDTTMADPSLSTEGSDKTFYKIQGVKLMPEDNFVKIVDDVVILIRENEIGVSKIDYQLDTSSPVAVELQKAGCSTMKINLVMTTTYPKFVKFLQQVADYHYVIDVDSFNIVGNRKNKEGYVKINLALNLFAQG